MIQGANCVVDVQEQRRYKRVVFREPYQLATRKGELLGASLTFDLSAGGIRLRTDEFLPVGSLVSIQFSCCNNQLLTIQGKVAWVQKVPHADSYQAGLQFDENEENLFFLSEIRKFVKKG